MQTTCLVGSVFALRSIRILFLITVGWVFVLADLTEHRQLIPTGRVSRLPCRSMKTIVNDGMGDALLVLHQLSSLIQDDEQFSYTPSMPYLLASAAILSDIGDLFLSTICRASLLRLFEGHFYLTPMSILSRSEKRSQVVGCVCTG